MKILRLDLVAFGPFSGVTLSPGEGRHGLHIVFGPNEAGKSSSLRALRNWLYDIPHNSPDNFVHPYSSLRIGGLLEAASGDRLEFIRRKGRTKTLRGPDDVDVVDDARLTDMLGGIDAETFNRRFGIDYQELRSGGDAIVRGGGELGEILFAAGSGIANLRKIPNQLSDDAEKLFKKRGKEQSINKAVSELNDLQRAIKQAQLPTDDWKRLNDELETAQERQNELEPQLGTRRVQQNRLERINRAQPLIGQRRQIHQQLSEVEAAPLLPDDFSEKRSAAASDLKNEIRARRDADDEIKRLQDSISGVKLPPGLLDHRTAISELHTRLGSHQKAAKDRPGLVAHLERLQKQAKTVLQELGREPQVDDADGFRITRAQRERIQSLAQQYAGHVEKQRTAERDSKRLREEIARVEAQLAALPQMKDVASLKRVLRRVQKQGDLDGQLAEQRNRLNALEQQADVELERLTLWSGTLDQLQRLPVPSLETIEHFEQGLTKAESDVDSIQDRIDELTEQARGFSQRLEQLQLEQDVPTEKDLAQARHHRDKGWHLIQQVWRDHLQESDPSVREFTGDFADLRAAFQAGVEAADAVADRLRREADSVAERARLTSDLRKLNERIAEQQQALRTAQNTLMETRSQWCNRWADCGIQPQSPREMRSWLSRQQGLAELAASIRTERDSVEQAAAHLRERQQELNEVLRSFGAAPDDREQTLASILEHCEQLIDEIEVANQRRRDGENSLNQLQNSLPAADDQAELARSELQHWRDNWAKAVESLGLDQDVQPAAATSVIASVDELTRLIDEVDGLRTRIEGIDSDADKFEQDVRSLLHQIATDLCELPVEQAVADLYDRLGQASTNKAQLDAWQKQLAAEQRKRALADSKIEQFQAELEQMCRQAGSTCADDLPQAEQRSKRRQKLEGELNSLNRQLSAEAAGAPLEEFVAEAEQFDQDQVHAELHRLGSEIEQLEEEQKNLAEAIGRCRALLQQMDGGDKAAQLQERAQFLLAQIRSDAEQYIRLKLASAVLKRSIERYREISQGPVLQRASQLFAQLTLGSFSGVRADYDEKGGALLVGVRPDGKAIVRVEGMSDGTCDQLYLALRLALLESALEGREPLPFIVDDILIMFDDQRAVAALKALAELSRKTQVIFFTHHEHLLELAREHLDPDVLFEHHLPSASPRVTSETA